MEAIFESITQQVQAVLPVAGPIVAALIGIPLAIKFFKRLAK